MKNKFIIDFHTHVGSCQKCGMLCNVKSMIKIMDKADIKIACISNVFWNDFWVGNKIVYDTIKKHPGRFIGFFYVNLQFPKLIYKELKKGIERLGFSALKIYPIYDNIPVTDERWKPIFRFAEERNMIILSHTEENNNLCAPEIFLKIAKKYKNIKWVLAHSGVFPSGRKSAVMVAKKCDNVYLEISSSYENFRSIEELVEGAGEDRVLFGSDMPLMDPRIHIGRVVTAEISDIAKEKILGLNASNLLNIKI